MITLHHLNNSRSQRILWLLEELGIPYQVTRYQRDPKTMLAPPELRAVHPLGKSPVITDGAQTVAESGAIVEYLADRYGSALIAPHGTPERLRQNYWLHYAEGSAMPPLLLKLVFQRVATTPAPFFVRPVLKGVAGKVQAGFVDPQIAAHLAYLEDELGRHPWFGGERFSVADIQMSFPLEAAAARGGLNANAQHPRLADFLQRIHARPAYQRALAQGGEYRLG
ncbi:glutathione S-transferase [Dyella sp.]|jgi:glutathione S-transferase|uniref:glutathione S-transferase family protein n=1 Tax=Dyella sp. TaxID=1869338 RepID=UPI002D79A295|nr:glutathione S-transferase [Dyella sp.]HET6431877.1 glutathione S-transferase [Dyella sp.]